MGVRSALVLVGSVGVVAALSRPPPPPPPESEPLLPRIETLRAVGAGYIPLLTDYFWIQTLQAVSRSDSPASARHIYDYARLVIDLDPHFREVYVFAAAAVIWQEGSGRYANTAESTGLLEAGYLNTPDNVLLRILLAYNLSAFHGQYLRAAKILEETAKMPGAPQYLSGYATRMYSQAGDFDSGLALARALIDESADPDTRAQFERRYQELRLERELTRVEEAAAAFQRREGRWPADVAELLRGGDLRAPPQDPTGGQIVLGAGGKAHSTATVQRLKLFKTGDER